MTVLINKFKLQDHRLGRHVEHDSRSRNFAFMLTPPPKQIDTFWSDSAPVLDQGDIGGCVGWTGADILNTDLFIPLRKAKNNAKAYTDQDALKFYELATHKDDISGYYPRVDSGSSGLGLAKALQSLGLIDRYSHCFTWNQFLAAIQIQPVALGTTWTNDMFNPDRHGVVRVGSLNESNIVGGHEYMCRGISFTKSLVLCRNHWGPTWNTKGDLPKLRGEFWLPFSDLKELLSSKNQGDVTVLHGTGLP